MYRPDKPALKVLSLGVGVQSSTILLMSCAGELDRLDYAVFADTQWEPKAVYKYLEWLKAVSTIPIIVKSKGDLRQFQVELLSGKVSSCVGRLPYYISNLDIGSRKVGMLTRQCTYHFKIRMVHKAIRELLGLKPRQWIPSGVMVEQWIGISCDEITRMKPCREDWIVNYWPLIDKGMTRKDCLDWMRKKHYPLPSKSACLACPFHDDRHWREMKLETPDEFQSVVEFDYGLRENLPLKYIKGIPYLHRSCKPIGEIDFRTLEDKGQESLFDGMNQECTGMCGV